MLGFEKVHKTRREWTFSPWLEAECESHADAAGGGLRRKSRRKRRSEMDEKSKLAQRIW